MKRPSVRYGSTMECVVYLAVDGGLPREVCRMGYQQWRCGREIPRLSALELGDIPKVVYETTPWLWFKVQWWRGYWAVRHWLEGR